MMRQIHVSVTKEIEVRGGETQPHVRKKTIRTPKLFSDIIPMFVEMQDKIR